MHPFCPFSCKPLALFSIVMSIAVSHLALAQPAPDDAWHASVGMGLISQPKYPGSSETRMGAMPAFNVTKGRWQLGALPGATLSVGASYTLVQDGPWRFALGAGTGIGSPRTAGAGAQPSGLGDIKATTLGTISGSYTEGAVIASTSVITDIGGNQQGTRALLDVAFKANPADKWTLTVGPGISWMDSQYAQTYYGVTAAQSASSGNSTYKASAGINAVRLGVGADYEISREWSVGAKLSAAKLQGDAANSPAVGKGTQTSYGIFANYRF